MTGSSTLSCLLEAAHETEQHDERPIQFSHHVASCATGTGVICHYHRAQVDSRFAVVNTMMVGNSADADTNSDCFGTFEAYGVNLVGNPAAAGCTTINAGLGLISLNTVAPPLQDNGGPTWTHALLPGSEAMDATIDSLGCVDENGAPLTTDQRGAPRVVGARCDVGAYEYDAADDVIFQNGFDQAAP